MTGLCSRFFCLKLSQIAVKDFSLDLPRRKFKLLEYYFWLIEDFVPHSCLINHSLRLIRFVCGSDNQISECSHTHLSHSDSHGTQTSAIDPWTQTRALIRSPTPASLSLGPQVSPPSLKPSLLPAAPAGLPPSPHQLQPIPCCARPLPLWPWEGVRGQRSFSPQLPQASLRSFRPRVWGPAALQSDTHTTLGQPEETGVPLLVFANDGLSQSNLAG